MSDLRIRTIDEGNLETVIADDVEFEGEMNLTDPILIKGQVSGSVNSGSNVYIGEQARMDTQIDAPLVSIKGSVSGDVRARDRLELFKSGSLNGKVTTPDLIVQSGALFNGTCEMPRNFQQAQESGDE